MKAERINAFLVALERVMDEKLKIPVKKTGLAPYQSLESSHYHLMVLVAISTPGLSRIIYYFPRQTAHQLAREMFFGLEITDEQLVQTAIMELFYRITSQATEFQPDLRVNDAPVVRKAELLPDEEQFSGLTLTFETPAGPFLMCALDRY